MEMTALETAVRLRDAGVVLLQKAGKQSERDGIVFERHTAENPEPRLSLLLSRFRPDGCFSLNVWAMREGKHVKVLNIEWLNDSIELVSFRRGEWETELLAMGAAVAVH